MRNLNYQLKQLSRQNRNGSHRTHRDRTWILSCNAHKMHAFSYRKMSVRPLKPKHVEALVERWRNEAFAIGTIMDC